MAAIELTESQKQILTALINLAREQDGPVIAETIAEEIDRASGTIRNQMQQLKALHLVEGISGPKGGYVPTAAAFETLNLDQVDQPAVVPIILNKRRVEGANVDEISLTNVSHPKKCRAEIHVLGSLDQYQYNDDLRIGPTPRAGLVIYGTVEGTDNANGTVILQIERMGIEEREH